MSRSRPASCCSIGSAGYRSVGSARLPRDVGSRTVSRRNLLVEQAKINRQLCPMMRGMQHAPPEHPDALALHVEEACGPEPPPFLLRRQKIQSRRGELRHPARKRIHGLLHRKDARWLRLRRAQEFGEEASLRQQLMLQDVRGGARTRMRTEAQIPIAESPPDRDHLIRLSGVDIERMLKSSRRRERDAFCRDRGMVVFHWSSVRPICTSETFRPIRPL